MALTTGTTASRTIERTTLLDAPVDRVWEAMLRPSTFLHVARGLLGVPALEGRIDPFVAGEAGTAWLLLFHLVPFSRHTIEVVDVDHERHVVRTHEHGGLLRRWDHTLAAEAEGPDRTRYTDTIVVEAGPLTPVAARVGNLIFRYRQRRWRALARRHLGPTWSVRDEKLAEIAQEGT